MFRSVIVCSLAVLLLSSTGCSTDPATPEHWEKALKKAPKAKDRSRVLDDLRSSGLLTPAFLPLLQKQLESEKSSEVKAAVARMLGEMKDPSSVEPLVGALDLGNTETSASTMNKEIAAALGVIGDPKSVPTLIKLLNVKDNYTKIEAINALGALRRKEALEKLISIATDESGEPFISKKAIQALGEIGDESAIPALTQMMFKERRGISFYMESSFALYQIGDKSADAMLPILKGEDKALTKWAQDNNILEAALFAKAAQMLGDLHDPRSEQALLSRLAYENGMLDVKLFVRMRAADALGRMRSRPAAKVLASMLGEDEANARQEYIRALNRIGGPEAIPALIKASAVGSWDAREPSMIGVSMLGGESELAAFDKLAADEAKLTEAECKENPDYAGCTAPAELVKKHVAAIGTLKKRLEAARDCKADAACWVKKLDDAETGVRERAAYELGRSGKPEVVADLMKHLHEKNLDARLAIIQGVDWLVSDSKDAGAKAKTMLSDLEKQVTDEKGKTEFVKVNEDLRRLAAKLKRS